MQNSYNVVVVGATSLAGREFVKVLGERGFPVRELRLLDTGHINGQRVAFGSRELPVGEITARAFQGAGFVFLLGSVESSLMAVSLAPLDKAMIIDGSPAYRVDPEVPLIVPDVNPQALRRGLVASPNPATVQVLRAIHPLHRQNPLKGLVVDTMHSVSETGATAIEELSAQSRQVLQGRAGIPHTYTHQIAFNILPETDLFLDNGYTRTEWSLMEGIRKVLGMPNLAIAATSVRVPVHVGDCQIVYARFTNYIGADDARAILSRAAEVRIVDDPVVGLYPQPWAVTGEEQVLVGRLREDASQPNGIAMWVVADNLRQGVVLNMLRIAELALERGLV